MIIQNRLTLHLPKALYRKEASPRAGDLWSWSTILKIKGNLFIKGKKLGKDVVFVRPNHHQNHNCHILVTDVTPVL